VSAAAASPPAGLGVLGGTFNPPHAGHTALARAALGELGLERVLLVPARVAPHKRLAEDPGPGHRLKMCRLAAEDEPGLEVSTLELDRPGPSYTVDTLNLIHANHPQVPLTLIVGADVALTLPLWRRPREIARLARLAVAVRTGTERDAVLAALRTLDKAAPVFLAMDPVEASSSDIRARVAAGRPLEGLVSGRVHDYIDAHRLYLGEPHHASSAVEAG
jgi:nicotinate-nucleotide adenylyltransferase